MFGHGPTARTMRRVRGLLAPHRSRLGLAVALATLACLLNLPIPLLIQNLVDSVVAGFGSALLPLYALGLLAVFAAQSAVGLANTLVVGRIGLSVVRDLRHRLYEHLQKLGIAYYDRTPAGAIISRVTDDVNAVQNLVAGPTISAVTDLGGAMVIGGFMLYHWPRLFLAVVLVLPLYYLIFRAFTHHIRAASAAMRQRLDAQYAHLKEKIDGALVVKAHAREESEMDAFAEQVDATHQRRVRCGRLGLTFNHLTAAVSSVGASIVFALGAFEVLHGRMTPGEVISATALAALLFAPIPRLADLATIFQQASASFARLDDILETKPEPVGVVALQPAGEVRGQIEFDHVGFAYTPGRPVVQDVRLKIEPGMKVALVGPTGCGKSTLLNLMLRFYDPTWGEILLDGAPIRQFDPAELRRRIGVVPQDPVVFRMSLADNIRYGVPDASDARVEAAARAALVHDFAMKLPDGYQTIVGEGGHKLSQGERQRIAIARAFCLDPSIIILDEATSSLDTASEMQIQEALANLLDNRTALIVAHRLSTVVDADRIVVLDGGRVVQVGTHEQLVADRTGLYHKLCLRQFGEAMKREQANAAGKPILPPQSLPLPPLPVAYPAFGAPV